MRLLNPRSPRIKPDRVYVSILVLVDAPLECSMISCFVPKFFVSILVLVDAPLESSWMMAAPINQGVPGCFNPCFSGCASWIRIFRRRLETLISFNPCFSGCASWIKYLVRSLKLGDSFNPCFSGCASWILRTGTQKFLVGGFNPCFSGCASWIQYGLLHTEHVFGFQSLF